MKLIEAMKLLKLNEQKVVDNNKQIRELSANLSHETPLYKDQELRVRSLAQANDDLANNNVDLLISIQRTNLATVVPITIGNKTVSRSIAAWVWRRRKYAEMSKLTWSQMSDRGLKEGTLPSTTGSEPLKVTIVRHYDPKLRDEKIAEYRDEPFLIDSALEIVNAVTDLV